jgi:hypothetical protein
MKSEHWCFVGGTLFGLAVGMLATAHFGWPHVGKFAPPTTPAK